MLAGLNKLFAYIFPSSQDEKVLEECSDEDFLNAYTVLTEKEVTSLLPFSNKAVKAALHLAKFHNHPRATALLGKILAKHLEKAPTPLLIPIPLSSKRLRQRGYNQVEEIIKAGGLEHMMKADVLFRRIHTDPQTSLTRERRLKNVAEAFGIRDHEKAKTLIAGRHVYIIDDVATTGATLKASRALLATLHPSSITCIALAH